MKKLILSLVLAGSPLLAAAQPAITNADGVFTRAASFINVAMWFMVSLAVLFIVWNTFQFIRKADSADDRKSFGAAIMWGIVGLFVILSIWGFVYILRNTFGTTGYGAPSEGELQRLVPRRPTPTTSTPTTPQP